MGERLLCKQEVIGSIPFTSTIRWKRAREIAATRQEEVIRDPVHWIGDADGAD